MSNELYSHKAQSDKWKRKWGDWVNGRKQQAKTIYGLEMKKIEVFRNLDRDYIPGPVLYLFQYGIILIDGILHLWDFISYLAP